MSRSKNILCEPLAVRAACHARISIDIASPREGELVIEHLRAKELLARECRPLAVGDRALEIKTHPEASHIVCSLHAGDRPIDGVHFNVDCGQSIEPTARHFIVIGAMKAGTTTLFEMLAQHPAICSAWAQAPGVRFTKEINYFRKQYRDGDSPLHYDWRFPFDPAKHAWTLDVSPNYAKLPGSRAVPRRIAALAGETKLAYILREPVDRIESHLAQTLRTAGEHKNLQHCIRTSHYARHLDRFTDYMSRDQILLLNFHELQQDPAAVMAQICDFLEIDPFVARARIHNKRAIDFRLEETQRAELAEAVRSDVRRLINRYGFKAAEGWLQRRP